MSYNEKSLESHSNVIFTDIPILHHYYIEDGILNQTQVKLDNSSFNGESDLIEYIEQLKQHGYSFYVKINSTRITYNPTDFTPIINLWCKAVKGLKAKPITIKQKDNDRRKYLLLA